MSQVLAGKKIESRRFRSLMILLFFLTGCSFNSTPKSFEGIESTYPTDSLYNIPNNKGGLHGNLFMHIKAGIIAVNLTTNEQTSFLKPDSSWLAWDAQFAQNSKHVAYWFQSNNTFELWMASLNKWEPQKILSFNVTDFEFDFATLSWVVDDQYLVLDFSVEEGSGFFQEIKSVRSYVYKVDNPSVDERLFEVHGACNQLAPSPKSERLTLWCKNAQNFLVLEPNDNPWITNENPSTISDNCSSISTCAWASEAKYIAVVLSESKLIYSETTNYDPIALVNEPSQIVSFPIWSHDSQYLFASMNCADSLQCPTVLAKQNGNILWQEHRLPDDSLSKTFSVTKRAWSPHNHYIALISGAYDNEIVVFDFIKNDVIRVYEDSNSQNIFEVVWVD